LAEVICLKTDSSVVVTESSKSLDEGLSVIEPFSFESSSRSDKEVTEYEQNHSSIIPTKERDKGNLSYPKTDGDVGHTNSNRKQNIETALNFYQAHNVPSQNNIPRKDNLLTTQKEHWSTLSDKVGDVKTQLLQLKNKHVENRSAAMERRDKFYESFKAKTNNPPPKPSNCSPSPIKSPIKSPISVQGLLSSSSHK